MERCLVTILFGVPFRFSTQGPCMMRCSCDFSLDGLRDHDQFIALPIRILWVQTRIIHAFDAPVAYHAITTAWTLVSALQNMTHSTQQLSQLIRRLLHRSQFILQPHKRALHVNRASPILHQPSDRGLVFVLNTLRERLDFGPEELGRV